MEILCTKTHSEKPPPLVSLTFLGLFLCNYGAWAGYIIMFHSLGRSSFLPVQLCLVQSRLDWLYVPVLFACSRAGSTWGTFLRHPLLVPEPCPVLCSTSVHLFQHSFTFGNIPVTSRSCSTTDSSLSAGFQSYEIKPNEGLSYPFFENGQRKLPSKTEGRRDEETF